MEKETLFTTSKWEIIQALAREPSAPLGIAKTLNTTIANVSQQLRLLEAAGLVQKKRLANVEAGMPRALYSLSSDVAFLSLAANGGAKKKLLYLSPLQIIASRCWLLENTISDTLSSFFYSINEEVSSFKEVYYKEHSSKEIVLVSSTSFVKPSYSFTFNKKSYTITIMTEKVIQNKDSLKILYKENTL